MGVPGDAVPQAPSRCCCRCQHCPATVTCGTEGAAPRGGGSQFSPSCVTVNKDPAAQFSTMKTSPTCAGVVLHPLVLVVSQGAGQG